ncbi:TPA: hypothetical protein DDZ10_03435 [Candidatus Uhrbacteria bacterium]|nr:MAG: hypothetical protein UY79_C0007G0005 [Parcubacteria group bacterium GW2011_GWA2_53_21]HBL39695.1 hypothetical protein [Candidatus Uhrbacteria bacterium]
MNDKKKRLVLIAGILVLLLILLLLFWPKKKQPEAPLTETPSASPAPVAETSLVAPLIEREVPTPSQASAEAVARTFAERYASFSAESHFINITDLFPIMTDAFRTRQKVFIESAEPLDEYYGVTSKIVSLSAVLFTDSVAVVDASLQRIEARGSAQNMATKYETLRLNLVFENGSWLVDGAEWSKE